MIDNTVAVWICGTFLRKGHEGHSSFSVLRETSIAPIKFKKDLTGYPNGELLR